MRISCCNLHTALQVHAILIVTFNIVRDYKRREFTPLAQPCVFYGLSRSHLTVLIRMPACSARTNAWMLKVEDVSCPLCATCQMTDTRDNLLDIYSDNSLHLNTLMFSLSSIRLRVQLPSETTFLIEKVNRRRFVQHLHIKLLQ